MNVQPNTGAVRRSLVDFDLPLTPDGCSVTAASFKLWVERDRRLADDERLPVGRRLDGDGRHLEQPARHDGQRRRGHLYGREHVDVLDRDVDRRRPSTAARTTASSSRTRTRASGTVLQTYHSRENTNDPQLVITFGLRTASWRENDKWRARRMAHDRRGGAPARSGCGPRSARRYVTPDRRGRAARGDAGTTRSAGSGPHGTSPGNSSGRHRSTRHTPPAPVLGSRPAPGRSARHGTAGRARRAAADPKRRRPRALHRFRTRGPAPRLELRQRHVHRREIRPMSASTASQRNRAPEPVRPARHARHAPASPRRSRAAASRPTRRTTAARARA